MTISSTTVVTRTNTNGSSHTFNFAHPFLDPDDLTVWLVTTADWTIALQVRDTDYTVSENGDEDENGGSITFIDDLGAPEAPATGKVCVILRQPDAIQDYNPGATFEATQGESALDRLYQMVQLLLYRSDRTVRLNDAFADQDVILPDATERADKVVGFDADGVIEMKVSGETVLADSEAAQAAAEAAQASAESSASSATSSASAASVSATLAQDWATKVNGIVGGTDYSSKAWAIGGTDVTETAARGAAKEWAVKTDDVVDTDEGSAKAYAVGGTGVSETANRGAAKEWATKITGAVDTAEYSAKAYAVGGDGVDIGHGSAKDWAVKEGGFVGGTALLSAKAYADLAEASAEAAAAASENPAVTYTFDSSTTDADPGDGEFRFNHASPASATEIYFDNEDANGNDVTSLLDFMDDADNANGKGLLVIRDVNDQTALAIFNITGAVTDGTGYRKVGVANLVDGGGTFSGLCAILFVPAGNDQDAASILAALLTVDGAGSGLDADLLDGMSSAAFAAASHDHAISDVTDLQTTLDGKQPLDATLTDLAALGDAGADAGLFWDDSESSIDYWTPSGALSFSGTTLVVAAAAEGNTGTVEQATDAEIRASSAGALGIMAEDLSTAAAVVTLTDAATIAIDWASGINFDVTLTTNRILGNPTNEVAGQWRQVLVKSDGGPDTLTFGAEYGGEVPTIDDVTTTQFYQLFIYCKAAGQFLVTAIDGSDA